MSVLQQLMEGYDFKPKHPPADEEMEQEFTRLLIDPTQKLTHDAAILCEDYEVASGLEDSVKVLLVFEDGGVPSSVMPLSKYVACKDTSGQEYLIGMPECWCEFHKCIVGRIEIALGVSIEKEAVRGGAVYVEEGFVLCNGTSQDYGEADHDRARELFQSVVGDFLG